MEKIGANQSTLLNYYQGWGGVGWHTNYKSAGYQVVLTWSRLETVVSRGMTRRLTPYIWNMINTVGKQGGFILETKKVPLRITAGIRCGRTVTDLLSATIGH